MTGQHRRHYPAGTSLTTREQEVLELIVAGGSSKSIAHRLGISPRTVEVHRGHIMAKMGADRLADLFRIYYERRYHVAAQVSAGPWQVPGPV